MKKAILAICLCCNYVNAECFTISQLYRYVSIEEQSIDNEIARRYDYYTPSESDWLDGYYFGLSTAYADIREFIEHAQKKGKLCNE